MKQSTLLTIITSIILLTTYKANAQTTYELNTGWKCIKAGNVKVSGDKISAVGYNIANWMPATVPGTVLTTLLNNKKIPDPFYGMNNNLIPEIYKTGRDYYTYWFVKNFKEAQGTQQVYLNFRGVNYSCDIYLNGKKLNKTTQEGMFLRYSYNITTYLSKTGNNRLAVLVHPPDFPGNPNGGQGGDGTIAKGVGLQYTAGWDWIQPIRDRNTGIWDKVTIQKTGKVRIVDAHVVTLVPGVRQTDGPQQPAIIKVSAELSNPTNTSVIGVLKYEIGGQSVSQKVTLKPNADEQFDLADLSLQNPKLWWPNGYGPQNLYPLHLQFLVNGASLSDQQTQMIGVRQLHTEWNAHTSSRQVEVNGQKIFIKGGNWIVSDAMLRLSDKRYDAEVHFHRDMNLNLIRVWGGAMIERPEFYDACDKYGLLVFQDFWGSGDCNGRWKDPAKLEDQATRRKYPDDHALFLRSAEDQVKMIRNHASLAIWCGGNEITPPDDILKALRDTIMPKLDSTRWFVEFSNSEAMSYSKTAGNGDGPYGIQPLSVFWQHQTYPFNSEVGSVGLSDIYALRRFIPAANMVPPVYDSVTHKTRADSVWDYHKYIGYDTSISKYGPVKDVEDFAMKAQLVNYDQYRGLAEGFTSHMWDWYTGTIIWKTQNPWTAMRGQMYDYYLDPNACLYGLHNGSEPVHIMYNPVTGMVMAANNTFKNVNNMQVVIKLYKLNGKLIPVNNGIPADLAPTSVKEFVSIKDIVDQIAAKEGALLDLELLDAGKKMVSQNIYWLPDSSHNYTGLQKMALCKLQVYAKYTQPGKITLSLKNAKTNVPSFFNRISVVDEVTGQRLLPVFYSDNYVTLLPGEEKTITIDCDSFKGKKIKVSIKGWNTPTGYATVVN